MNNQHIQPITQPAILRCRDICEHLGDLVAKIGIGQYQIKQSCYIATEQGSRPILRNRAEDVLTYGDMLQFMNEYRSDSLYFVLESD